MMFVKLYLKSLNKGIIMLKEQLKKIKAELFGKTEILDDISTKKELSNKKNTIGNKSKVKNSKKNNRRKPKTKQKNFNSEKRQKRRTDTNTYPLIGCFNNNHELKEVPSKEFKINFEVKELKKPERSTLNDLLHSPNNNEHFIEELEKIESIDIAKSQELVIGLDFGTAFTKVVVGSEIDAEALKFGKYGYILPSQFYADSEGNCSLYESSVHCFKDLKIPILMRNSSLHDQLVIVCFLALVLKECRNWRKDSIYRDVDVDWLINSGLPTENYHEKGVVDLYRKLINAAWLCSFQKSINIKKCNDVINHIETGDLNNLEDYILHPECLNLFPEFAAQIVGYVQSPSRRKHSHLLVDIGAGTMDVAMFIVSNNKGEWLFETTAKDIQTLGGDILAKHRMQHSNKIINVGKDVPTDINFAQLLGIKLDKLKLIDKPFVIAVNNSLNKVVNRVAGGYSFVVDITTFVCGGGSKIELYQNQVNALKTKFPIQIITLPKPERLKNPDVNSENYHRLSVAYGLSYDPLNIGKVIEKSVDLKQPIYKRSHKIQSKIERNMTEFYK